MSQGVVFKQWYKSANLPQTPVLNSKHMEYIATRHGSMHNEGCSFGLWGKVPGAAVAENMNSLAAARHMMMDASGSHTVYRNIISVDGATADLFDLYRRETWEPLLARQVDALAKGMDIQRKDFCWIASMHCAKGHPHIHIMCWDNSSAIHREYMSQARFEDFSAKVREAFNGDIFKEQLRVPLGEEKAVAKQIRLELQGMCREANLGETLNLNHVSKPARDALGAALAALALQLPKGGRLSYKLLPPEFKQQLDAFVDQVLKITDFQHLAERYETLVDQVSDLYENNDARRAEQHEHARRQLHADLGNGVLQVLREYLAAERAAAPKKADALQLAVQKSVRAILPHNEHYKALTRLMPKLRTPNHAILADPKFAEIKRKLVQELCNDLRIRTKVQGYLSAGTAQKAGTGESAEEEKRALIAGVYRDLNRTVGGVVMEQLRWSAGYEQQRQADAAVSLVLQLFRLGSQGVGQLQSRRDLARGTRALSATAKKDRQKRREQEGSWDAER